MECKREEKKEMDMRIESISSRGYWSTLLNPENIMAQKDLKMKLGVVIVMAGELERPEGKQQRSTA